MTSFSGRNVNELYYTAMLSFRRKDMPRLDSRNGPMLEIPGPVLSTFWKPDELVLFDETRDANPFFHLMEAIWMAAGLNNVDWPARFAKNVSSYSDDGMILNGAYGFRWRTHFNTDQIIWAIHELRNDPDSRRVVLSMWDAREDPRSARAGSKDVPCNTQLFLKIRDGRLNMTVCNRSNDAIWGLYGANCVHFGFFMQYMAMHLGVRVGQYSHLSDSLHVYPEFPITQRLFEEPLNLAHDPYRFDIFPFTLQSPEQFEEGLAEWAVWMMRNEPASSFTKVGHPFFDTVALPMLNAHAAFKEGDWSSAFQLVGAVQAPDWKLAAHKWLQRRQSKAL